MPKGCEVTVETSVVLPVHNGMPYLDAAVESILEQSYADFELVALDNGSEDGSMAALERWARRDARVIVRREPRRLGCAASAREVVRLSNGGFVARMDADDVAHPHRLRRQVEIMRAQPEIAAIGTLAVGIDDRGRVVRPRDRGRLIRTRGSTTPFPHGSVMFRRSAYDDVGGYRAECDGWEDTDLFARMTAVGIVATIPHALYRYRYHASSTTVAGALPADAASYAALSGMQVWAGQRAARPAVSAVPWRLATRVVPYATWGRVHPASLRAAMAAWVRVLDGIGTLRTRRRSLVEWSP